MIKKEKKKTMNEIKLNDEPNEKLLKLIDLWFEWDQCEETRKEIEDLKVNFN